MSNVFCRICEGVVETRVPAICLNVGSFTRSGDGWEFGEELFDDGEESLFFHTHCVEEGFPDTDADGNKVCPYCDCRLTGEETVYAFELGHLYQGRDREMAFEADGPTVYVCTECAEEGFSGVEEDYMVAARILGTGPYAGD